METRDANPHAYQYANSLLTSFTLHDYPTIPRTTIMEKSDDCPSDHPESKSQPFPIPSVPTRIILRLLVQDFDGNGFSWLHYPTAIKAYLNWANRPLAD